MDKAIVAESEPQAMPESPLAKLDTGDKMFFSRRCAVCRSKVRVQVEAMHEKAEPLAEMCRVLAEAGDTVSQRQVQYHFQAHYSNVVTELAKAEYVDAMTEMVKRRRTMVEDAESLLAAAWTELLRVAILQTNGDLSKEHMRQKMIVEHSMTILKALEFMKSMQDGDARAKATEEKFVKVWTLKINGAKDENEKGVLIATLKDFQEKIRQL